MDSPISRSSSDVNLDASEPKAKPADPEVKDSGNQQPGRPSNDSRWQVDDPAEGSEVVAANSDAASSDDASSPEGMPSISLSTDSADSASPSKKTSGKKSSGKKSKEARAKQKQEATASVPSNSDAEPDAEDDEAAASPAGPGNRFLVFAALPGWFVSMIIHMLLLFCLALLTLPPVLKQIDNEIELGDAESTQIEDAPIFESLETEELEDLELTDLTPTDPVDVQPTELETDVPDVFSADDLEAAPVFTELDPLGSDVASQSDMMKQLGTFSGAGLEGRGKASRARLVREGGGTEGSEKAVQLALKWLAQHQNPNGSWSFQHLGGNCPCRDPGSKDKAYNGATAMALLPFLGAGHTHKEGQYKRVVQAGLYFLLSQQKRNGALIESGGNLYSHGLCAIALSEAYAMTQDQMLMAPAQGALNYIAYAQDPVGGGWRYVAKQPGDTSVVGWQLMALKSGRMAYLHVDPSVFRGASKFLDSVQTDEGAAYGYKDPGRKPSTSAIGLLCRMYLGWEKNHPGIKGGVKRLSDAGPSKKDMYYNYYATQVMRHYEGPEWKKWNEEMREFLVESQAKKGHETGSWYMGASHSSVSGGRLYCTAMATMILEVYYRHLPIYQKQVTEDDFEL